ncbi:MAG: sulfite exporter TauE/SafE family protein [Prochlorothrix sp.]
MLDLLLMVSLGFLGSFGHCVGMCGPLSLAFTLPHDSPLPPVGTDRADAAPNPPTDALRFQLLLNLGRILSYALVGAAIGWVGSVLLAGGQMAGVGSGLRRGLGLLTGGLLVWFGLVQVSPGLLPQVPLLNPMAQGHLHDRLSRIMGHLAQKSSLWTPLSLGLVWGLMPCGFLYAAQIKAAETGNWVQGALTMVAFGLGTAPTMVGVGLWVGLMSQDRRSQLFRLGGWITLLIGLLTLTRTGDMLMGYSGHGAIVALALALVARPLQPWWRGLLQYRRGLGVGGFVLALAHSVQMLEHSWNWNWQAIAFLLPQHQWAMAAGAVSLMLMTPAALTSFDQAQQRLGANWRRIHLLGLPAFLLAAVHALFLGSHYLGQLRVTGGNAIAIAALGLLVLAVLLLRSAWFSHRFGLRRPRPNPEAISPTKDSLTPLDASLLSQTPNSADCSTCKPVSGRSPS